MINFIFSKGGFSKWYQSIIWWEIYRIPYNIIMLIIGIISIAVAAINIPFIYFLMGLMLNVGYGSLWMIELYYKKELLEKEEIKSHRKKAFAIYLVISVFSVFIIPLSLLFIKYLAGAHLQCIPIFKSI